MSTNHNRIRVADLETNQQNKILTTNSAGELEFTDINTIQIDSYNALDYTSEGKALDARQGKVLKDLTDNKVDKVNGKNLLSDTEITRLSSLKNVVIATDSETQITSTVIEDNKVVSRSKLFNWWTSIKTEPQSITGLWTFKDQITLANGTTTRYPIRIPEGVLLTTPVNGAIETDRKGIYYTINGVRKNLATEYVIDTSNMQDASVYLWGNNTVGVREDIFPMYLASNLKVFNDYTANQYGKYTINISGILDSMGINVTDVKIELQMVISNSKNPDTWYTVSTFEDTRENIIASMPQQITLSAELLIRVLRDKYVFITGRASKSKSESYFKTKTQNLSTSDTDPKKNEMLVSFRLKATTTWNTAINYQNFTADFGLIKMIKT